MQDMEIMHGDSTEYGQPFVNQWLDELAGWDELGSKEHQWCWEVPPAIDKNQNQIVSVSETHKATGRF